MNKPEKARLPSSFLFSLAVFALSVIVGVLSSTLLRDWLIIRFGIRTFQLINTAEICVMVACAILTGVQTMPLIARKIRQKQMHEQEITQKKQQSRILSDYTEDSTNPDFTRRRLIQLRDGLPGVNDLIERCLGQMDKMDELQARQELLIGTNEALYLKDTVKVLDNVERRICRNFRNVINLCIVADDARHIDMREVEKNLSDNEKKLSDTKELLKASAKRINQYNTGDERSSWDEVEAWIKVILSSLKEEEDL